MLKICFQEGHHALIWTQTVLHSVCIPEIIFRKGKFEKKVSRRAIKA